MGGRISGDMGVDSFRGSTSRGYLPEASEMTSLGLFNEYFFQFDTLDTDKLLEAKTYVARMKDPISEDMEDYLGISLISSQDGKNHREPLNLVICLDISGSMKYTIDYDWSEEEQRDKTKLEISLEMISNIIGKMKENERLGIVLFDHNVSVFQEIKSVEDLNMPELVEKVKEIKERGGTNIEGGLELSIDMLKKLSEEDPSSKSNQNRIVFLTDGEPNYSTGNETEDSETVLYRLTKEAAEKDQIYVTYIGIGCDFNQELISKLSKVKGGNYFSAHTNSEFIRILDDDFNYIVTPVVFNVQLSIETPDYDVSSVYGTIYDSPQALKSLNSGKLKENPNSTDLMKIDTIIAGGKDERGTNGGVVLIKLGKKVSPKSDPDGESDLKKKKVIKVVLAYETLHGEKITDFDEIDFNYLFSKTTSTEGKEEEEEGGGENEEDISEKDIYQNLGIRKAILLAKYNDFIKQIIDSVNHQHKLNEEDSKHLVVESQFKGQPFKITERMKEDILNFRDEYFKREMDELEDVKLKGELELLDQFINLEAFKKKKELEEFDLKKEMEKRMVNGLQDPSKFMFPSSIKFQESQVCSESGKGMGGGLSANDVMKSTWYCDSGRSNERIPPSIEIVFSFDATGSMFEYIEIVKKNLKSIVKTLLQDIPSIRIGLIAHSDYCDHDSFFCLKKLDLTNHLPTLVQFIEMVDNGHGGDFDENYEQVLLEVRNLSWTKESSSKCLVVIGDADPHPKTSYFGIDWEEEVQKCKDELGMRIYGVQCNEISQTGFFRKIAEMTDGKYLQLEYVKEMVDVFVGLCYREDSMVQKEKKRSEILEKISSQEENDNSVVICLEGVCGRIDLFKDEDLSRIHTALHWKNWHVDQPKEVLINEKISGRVSLANKKGACMKYLRAQDLMFIEGEKIMDRFITWISISGKYGYIYSKELLGDDTFYPYEL